MQLQEDAMKPIRWILPLCLLGWSGCVSMPKMLPADYFQPRRTITVEVANCPPTPTLRTEQPGGNIAGTTWLARNEAMKNRMAGISPGMIQQAVGKELKKQLPDTFAVAEGEAQLALKVAIDEWGWSVPTGKYGESTGLHSFHIGGTASIVDLDPARNGAVVYFTYNSTDTPLGDHLTKEKCEAVLPGAAQDFAAQIVRFIQKGKPQ
jgi:CubicO group peptidase (beta-lactamase class C family)